jgi:hypothetical protein
MKRYGLDNQAYIPCRSWEYLLSAASRQALGPFMSRITHVPETDLSHPCSDEHKNGGATPSRPHTSSL